MKRKILESLLVLAIVILFIFPVVSSMSMRSFSSRDNYNIYHQSDKQQTSWYLQYPYDESSISNGRPPAVINEKSDLSTGEPMNSSWPMLSHDIYHTGRSLCSTELNLGAEIWRVRGHELGVVWSSPVIDENTTIYFGTTSSDSALYAIFPNGTMKWRYQADGRIWCTPTIAEDGTIYFTTWGGYGNMHALYPNGTVKWMFRDGYESSSLSSPTIGSDDTIYFGSDGSRTYAVHPNGTMKWFYSTGNSDGSPAIGSDGTVYIGSENHYLYALNLNGTLRWQFDAESMIRGSVSLAPDGTIYVPSFNGYFYALYPNGTLKWKAFTGDSIAAAGVALAEDGTIYVGTEQLRAFYPNGTLKWCTNVQGSIYGTVPAVSADGTIYISAGGSLVAVSPNGTERWRKQLTIAQIHSSPSIGPGDRVYVGSEDYGLSAYGYLHAFGPGEPKKIEIQQPELGKFYFFGNDLGMTPRNKTVIIGSVKVKVNVYSEDDIESVHFWFGGADQYNVSTPPFEWNMNHRYGQKLLTRGSITVVAHYKGSYSWSESIDVLYFHLLK